MKEEIRKNCIDCGQEFVLTPNQQIFYTSRGWIYPKRCKNCRERKKQDFQKKADEETARQFEKELLASQYAVKDISDIQIESSVTTLYVIGNGFDLAHCVPLSYSKFRDWLGYRSELRETLEEHIRNDALLWNFEEALADFDFVTPSMMIPEMLDEFNAYAPDAQIADY